MHLSSIIFEYFKDHTLIIPEILEFLELHTYKFGLVYLFHTDFLFMNANLVTKRHINSTTITTLFDYRRSQDMLLCFQSVTSNSI